MKKTGSPTIVFIESNTTGTGFLFVLAARALGFNPVLITANPAKYSFLHRPGAPVFITTPTGNVNAIESVIRDQVADPIAGITSSSEYFVASAAELAERFSLPGPDPVSVRSVRDKSFQRKTLATAGLPTPGFRVVETISEAACAAQTIGFPVVVKPVSASGSLGVRGCSSIVEVERHLRPLMSGADPSARFLVESLIEGCEYSVEIFCGEVVGITRKHLGAPPHFVEVGHDYPGDADSEVANSLVGNALRANQILGLGWGPVHWEMRVQAGQVYPIEVNPRMAGGFIPELIRLAQGIDLIRESVRLVAGERPCIKASESRSAAIRFIVAGQQGRLLEVRGLQVALASEFVHSVEMYRSLGAELTVHGDYRDRIGHVIASAESGSVARRAANLALAGIEVDIAPKDTAVHRRDTFYAIH